MYMPFVPLYGSLTSKPERPLDTPVAAESIEVTEEFNAVPDPADDVFLPDPPAVHSVCVDELNPPRLEEPAIVEHAELPSSLPLASMVTTCMKTHFDQAPVKTNRQLTTSTVRVSWPKQCANYDLSW